MSIENIVIRRASEEDVDQVTELVARLKSLNEELDPNFKVVNYLDKAVREYVQQSLKDDRVVLLVAYDAAAKLVAGVIRFELIDRHFYEPKIKAEITDLYVRPQYRRKKLGVMLVQRAMEEARKLGAGIVTVVYPAGNSIADSFYRSLKFSELNKELYRPCME